MYGNHVPYAGIRVFERHTEPSASADDESCNRVVFEGGVVEAIAKGDVRLERCARRIM